MSTVLIDPVSVYSLLRADLFLSADEPAQPDKDAGARHGKYQAADPAAAYADEAAEPAADETADQAEDDIHDEAVL